MVGFAGTQAAYERWVHKLFEALDLLESRLADRRYLTGEMITEADWRLFVIEYWEGVSHDPRPAAVARLLARRPMRA